MVENFWYLIMVFSGGIILKQLMFENTGFFGFPNYFIYFFLASIIIMLFLTMYQLLKFSASRKNVKKNNKNFVIFLSLTISAIVFIPLLFLLLNLIIIGLVSLIFNRQYFNEFGNSSFSVILFNYSGEFNYQTLSIPPDPFFDG